MVALVALVALFTVALFTVALFTVALLACVMGTKLGDAGPSTGLDAGLIIFW
jgi:hypothetical protein